MGWGLSRKARGDGFVRNRLGFGGIRGAHGVGREKEGREERKKRKKKKEEGADSGWCWAGPGPARVGWLGLAGRFSFFFNKLFPFFLFSILKTEIKT